MSVSMSTVVIRRGLHQQVQGQRRERAADSPAWQRAAGRARWLSWASLAYMTAEGAIAIAAAVLPARSPCSALGADSLIEGAGSIIIVWRFSGASHPCRRQHHAGDDGQRTRVARPELAAGRGRHHLAGQCPLNGDDHELAGRLADGERSTVGCLQHPQHIGHLVAAA